MSDLDKDIRRVLAGEDAIYDLEREEGVFSQMAAIFRGKMRWMAIFATVEVKWQIFYATGVVLLGMLMLLVKLWGWMQMTRYSLQREIKRLELRIVELAEARQREA